MCLFEPFDYPIRILIIKGSLVRAQVGPLRTLVKPYKQYVCGAFFYDRGGIRGGKNFLFHTFIGINQYT